jgi:hypothetical protein
VKANPMREVLLHSIQERKRALNISLKDNSRYSDRSKSGLRPRYNFSSSRKLKAQTAIKSFNDPVKVLDEKSNMHVRVTEMLQKRRSRFRSNPKDKQYNLSNNTRKSIALRILSKLQDWPGTENKTGKSFKKFYWTKDYSYCAFAKDEEIVDGFLLKP